MKIIADLHIHGKYARATSKQLDLAKLAEYAKIKGVGLLGTGDFTHPQWIEHIGTELTDDGTGIYRDKSGFPFVLQSEISLAYTHNAKGRRVHHLIYAPDLDAVKQITKFLLTRGRVDYDGRPIFGMSSIEFVESLHEISKDIEVVPAHIWTSWFGVLGSASGYDSLKECFEEKTKLIHAIETGMSSNPAMNWRIPSLDHITLLSNSDLHSHWPWRMGREANVFEFKELTFRNLLAGIREGRGLLETIEVNPNYGKYHFDGHRACNVSMSPDEARGVSDICPSCKRKMTIGVMHRINDLAKRDEGYVATDRVPFKTILPLSEIISTAQGSSLVSKKTWATYHRLVGPLGSEFDVVLDGDMTKIKHIAGDELAGLIARNREGSISVKPGYDGEYGELQLDDAGPERKRYSVKQKGLSEFI